MALRESSDAAYTKEIPGPLHRCRSEICHGKATFIGTRVMVWQVLEAARRGEPWDKIAADWPGSVSLEAVAEAVALARHDPSLARRKNI